MRIAHPLGTLALALTLTACGTSDSGIPLSGKKLSQCSFLTGGSADFGTVGRCLSCVFTDAGLAIDGDLSTYATLTFPASAEGGGYVEARAQEGIVFPEGSRAAAVVEIVKATSAEFTSTGTFTSYQGDEVKDEVEFQRGNLANINGVAGGAQHAILETTAAFDGLRVSLDGTFNNQTLRVYEFCGDSTSE